MKQLVTETRMTRTARGTDQTSSDRGVVAMASKGAISRTAEASSKRCSACREDRPRELMLRFVCSPDGELLWDPAHKADGRGLSLCMDWRCLGRLDAKLARAAGLSSVRPLTVTFWADFAERLGQVVLNTLGLYRRRQRLAIGATMTLTKLKQVPGPGELPVALVLLADDASERTAAELRREGGLVVTTVPKSGEKLGAAIGQGVVAVIGVIDEPARAQTLAAQVQLWANLKQLGDMRHG